MLYMFVSVSRTRYDKITVPLVFEVAVAYHARSSVYESAQMSEPSSGSLQKFMAYILR